MRVADVKHHHLQNIMNAQIGKSESNTLKILGVLKGLFSRAKQNGLIMDSPSEFLELPQTETNSRRALNAEERAAVLKVCETHRAGLWVMFMLYCGLRRGETIPLRWSDIDFERGRLTISKSVAFVKNRAVEKSTKTDNGNRIIPIPPPLLKRLLMEKDKPDAFIFNPARSVDMLTETNCKRLWDSFARDLDIAMGAKLYRNKIVSNVLSDDVTLHALRHTYATDLHAMGIDLKTAQYLLGHADIKTTANIYTHMREDTINNAATVQKRFYESQSATL